MHLRLACRALLRYVPAVLVMLLTAAACAAPIPDKVVVLTFDDSVRSHYTVVRPILKKYGFNATFFITEGFDFATDKENYMTWEQIAKLHHDGFEIGNHTRDHLSITADRAPQLAEQLQAIADACREHGIPKPISFAWPGNTFAVEALPVLQQHGIRLARRGGGPEYEYDQGRGFPYEPGLDHPLLIPSAGDARPDWTIDDFRRAIAQARHGKIAVLQFHGVPDGAHGWVSTPRDRFEQYMRILATEGYTVLALRDLLRYDGVTIAPRDPQMVIRDRQAVLAADAPAPSAGRPASDSKDRTRWLRLMIEQHQFTVHEAAAALDADAPQVAEWIRDANIDPNATPRRRDARGRLIITPFPGGRHPRIGFLDGAIRPQRETKLSVFAPWDDGGYAVADTPEAIWMQTEDGGRQLLYLAHTHVPTVWDKLGVTLKPLEWTEHADGRLTVQRTLPNQVAFGAEATPRPDGVALKLWLQNGSERTLSGLNVQNCVMLKSLNGFAERLNDNRNKVFSPPYAACRDQSGRRWIITGWTECKRPWGNEHCPCVHADPKFPDCPPGETRTLYGWISFYQGDDLSSELKRLDSIPWRHGFNHGKASATEKTDLPSSPQREPEERRPTADRSNQSEHRLERR